MMPKKFYLYDRFFVSNQNFTTEHIENVQQFSFDLTQKVYHINMIFLITSKKIFY